MRCVDLRRWALGPAAAVVLAGVACSEPRPPEPAPAATPEAMNAPAVPSSPETGAELAASEPGPYTLGREPLTVTLRVPEDRRERLAAIAAGSRPGSLRLVIEGIELLHPGAVHEVHLEPPEGRAPLSTDPSIVGHLALFGKPGEAPESTRTLDVTQRIRALPAGAREIRVTFMPGDRGEAPASGFPEASLRFRRIALVERPPAPPGS